MPHPIEPSTLRILRPTGETVGTGFLVSKHLAVTCAHVVKILGGGAGDKIDIRFTGKSAATTARVLPEYWRPDEATDIAILQVDEVPVGVFPLRMGRASESRLKNDLYTFGYAIAADQEGIGGLGTFITLKQEENFIQFRMHEANHGHSGAPIYDDKRGVVVGMIKKGYTGTGRNAETTFATPTETLWQVCPQLKPPTPVLPRRNPIVEGIHLLPYDYDQRIQNFLTEYLGTDAHPVPFGGRDDALKMLDTWLAQTTPYLLLAAPAGRGKSALLVRWLDSLKARDDLALAFVPVSIRFGTNMERVFYTALAARLAYLHGDDIPASPETSTAVYRGLVSDYLSKPLADGRTLLVVLDGLDEAADWQAGADFMPGELPAGVRVVVSARFLAGDADSKPWLRRLNWERNGLASAPSLTPLDQEGVRDVLFKMGCPLDELSRNVDIVAELYRLSEGDPLLVGLYVGDLWAKGDEVTRLQPEDLVGIHPGYRGYFDRWWEDQKKLWGKDKPWLEEHIWKVLNLLAGELGPLFKDDLQALAPELKSNYIADALEVLQRFIIGDNQIQGYTFSHPKLGQYFWDALTPAEQTQVEERFLAWGEQILQEFVDGKRDPKKKAEVPVYVMRNYGAHLARAEQPIEKWLPLIHHQQWAQAWFAVEGAYGGYSQDVQRIWEQCKHIDRQSTEHLSKTPFLGEQIRCAIIKSSLHSLASNIFPKLLWLLIREKIWTWPQVWATIRLIPQSPRRVEYILAILPELTKNQSQEALLVTRAVKEEDQRARILSGLADFISEEQLDQVLDLARAIKSDQERANVLSVLMQRLPKVTNEALEAALAIQDEWPRAHALSTLVQRLPEEQIYQVLNAAWDFKDEWPRTHLLSALTQYLSKEQLDIVLETTQEVRSKSLYADILIAQIKFLPRELLVQILEAVQEIEEQPRTRVMNALAPYFPGPQLNRFIEVVQKIKDGRLRVGVLSRLIQHIPESEVIALEAIQKIDDKEERAWALIELATCSPRLITMALDAIQAVDGKLTRSKMLTEIVKRLPESQLEKVLDVVLDFDDEFLRSDILDVIAQRLPISKLETVIQTARKIKDEWPRVRVLATIAERLPVITEEALQATHQIGDEESQLMLLNSLVQYLPEIDGYIAFVSHQIKHERKKKLYYPVYSKIKMPDLSSIDALSDIFSSERESSWHNFWNASKRAHELNNLAEQLPDNQLIQILGEIRHIGINHCTSTLKILIPRLPEDQLKETLDLVKRIRSDEQRIDVLVNLTKRLPEINGEVFNIVNRMRDEEKRHQYLRELVQPLSDAKYDDKYRYFDEFITISASRVRDTLFGNIQALLPWIIQLDQKILPNEIYHAVRDVTTWWP